MHATETQVEESLSTTFENILDVTWKAHHGKKKGDFLGSLAHRRHAVLTAMPLLAADLLAVLGSLSMAWLVAKTLWPSAPLDQVAFAPGFICAIVMANLAVGLYPGIGLSPVEEFRRSSFATALIGPIFMLVVLWHRTSDTLPIQFTILAVCASLLVALPLARTLARLLASRFAWWGQPAFVIGNELSASSIDGYLRRHRRLGLRSLGMIDDLQAFDAGSISELTREFESPWFVMVMPKEQLENTFASKHRLDQQSFPRRVICDSVDSPILWNCDKACLAWPGKHFWAGPSPLFHFFKRAIDVSLVLAGGLWLLPLFLLIVAIIRCTSAGAAFYCQERIGRNGQTFKVWKFRTMMLNADRVLHDFLDDNPQWKTEWERDHKLQNDPRITTIGRWLRKTSLDELPQLWNVLRGEMSLVGPRPIVSAEIAKYGDFFPAYCSVLPGITGLWQVSGRNDTTYDERVELDRFYARNASCWLDLYILASTVKVVLFRQGAY